MIVVALLLSLVGCTCQGPDNVKEVTEVGTACLDKDGHVRVGFGGCISSTCDTVLHASCAATVEGKAVTVKGSAAIRHEGTDCVEDCRAALATCEGPVIDDPAGMTINATKTPNLVRCWQ